MLGVELFTTFFNQDPTKAGQKKYPKGLQLQVIANIENKYKYPPVTFKRPNSDNFTCRVNGIG